MALYQQSISLQTVSSELKIFAKGGNGGNANTNNGEGGGGGGGLIFTNITYISCQNRYQYCRRFKGNKRYCRPTDTQKMDNSELVIANF